MQSYFVTGTDTNVGKTVISAGLVRALVNKGIDVGVMKPFATGKPQSKGFLSEDAEILAKAAKTSDPETLLNPQFFSIPASPFTASINLNQQVDLSKVMSGYEALEKKHETMIVEGIGGVMTPILEDYFVANLIKDMDLSTIIITRTKIGTLNHTLLTTKICDHYGISIKGIIINNFDSEGYPVLELKRDLEKLCGSKVLGIIPRLSDLSIDTFSDVVTKEIDFEDL